MEQVDAEGDVGDDVDDRAPGTRLKLATKLWYDVAPRRSRGSADAPREVGRWKMRKSGDDDARSSASCGWRSWRPRSARRLVVRARARWFISGERVGGVDVEHEGDDQPDAQDPQRATVRGKNGTRRSRRTSP